MDANIDLNSTIGNGSNGLANQFQNDVFGKLMETANSFLAYLMKLFSNTMQLVQTNTYWLIAIIALTYALHYFVMSRFFQGWVSFLVSFIVIMSFAFVWIPMVGGFIH